MTISAFKPVVSVVVGEETKKYGSLSEAISKVAANAELKLTDAITLTEAIEVDKNITINLNGKKLSVTLVEESVESMFDLAGGVTLTITDTEGGVLEVIGGDRTIALVQTGMATVAINRGTIDAAAVADDQLSYVITGGKFLATANEGGITVADSNAYVATLTDGYYVVTKKVVEEEDVFEESKDLVDVEGSSATEAEINAALEGLATALGATTDKDVAVTNYITKAYGNGGIKVDVLLAVGDGTAKNLDISIKYNLPVMTSDNAEFSVESSATTGDTVAAFEFSLNDGGTVRDLAEGVLEKALELIQVRADLSGETSWGNATANDVDYAISNGKLKVQLKKNGKGFMKLQAK